MQEKPPERRKEIRLDSRIPMRYRKIEANTREFKGSLIKNISASGVKITNYEFLPLNSRLAMEIALASGRKVVEGICRVAWVKKAPFSEQYDIGVEFVNLDQGDEGQISDFIFSRNLQGLV